MPRLAHIRDITIEDEGGGNSQNFTAHFLGDGSSIAPNNPEEGTWRRTTRRVGYGYDFNLIFKTAGTINIVKEAFLGLPPSSGAYQASSNDPDTTPAEWFSVGRMDAASLAFTPISRPDTQLLPLYRCASVDGGAMLTDLSAAHKTLLDARDQSEIDIALKRADDSFLILKQAYFESFLDVTEAEDGAQMFTTRFQTRVVNMETVIPSLAGTEPWDYLNAKQIANGNLRITATMLDGNAIVFEPVGFSVVPILNLAEGSLDGYALTGYGFAPSEAGLITLSPVLS